MTDHANELRSYARKIAHQAGDVHAVMLAAADEIERLRAKIEAMEKQEPVVYQRLYRDGSGTEDITDLPDVFERQRPLYTLPGAQPTPSVPTPVLVAIADLVTQMEIMARVGFIDTPDDKDSCAAFCVAEGTWLELMKCVESLAVSLAAAPEAKP